MIKVILEVPIGTHYKSTDICYNGGFVKVTQCEDCKGTQDYWSNNSSICKTCGGTLKTIGIGRWDNKSKKWEIRQGVEKC